MEIPFNIPLQIGEEISFIKELLSSNLVSSNGPYTKQCEDLIQQTTGTKKALLTSSCTHALEMCSLLLDIGDGDEIIMSSYNFVSAANAFVLRGAKIVFVDIDKNTLNIDPDKIENAISENTKALLVMHYGGIACDMSKIMEIASKHSIPVIEDAAHCIGSYYKKQHLGTIGDLGTFSFHYTKNIHCGEGGALLINNPKYIERAQILRDKGTNRQLFLDSQVGKYTWVSKGSSYSLSEISAAFLLSQLLSLKKVSDKRLKIWKQYYQLLKPLKDQGIIELQIENRELQSNAHVFYIKCKNQLDRKALIAYLKEHKISCSFHYVPLHTSIAGKKYTSFCGIDKYTTIESFRLLRLPLYYSISNEEIKRVAQVITSYYS